MSEWATASVLSALAGRARSEEERGGAPAEGAARVRGERERAGERRARVSAVIRAERRPRGRPTLSAGTTPTRHVAAGRFKRPPFHGSVFTLLGLLAKIKCSICSYQFDLWYAGH